MYVFEFYLSGTQLSNFFSGFLFATAKVASITTMIYFHITLHPTVHIHDFHNYIHNFTQLRILLTVIWCYFSDRFLSHSRFKGTHFI